MTNVMSSKTEEGFLALDDQGMAAMVVMPVARRRAVNFIVE